jgi:hypothetical protein
MCKKLRYLIIKIWPGHLSVFKVDFSETPKSSSGAQELRAIELGSGRVASSHLTEARQPRAQLYDARRHSRVSGGRVAHDPPAPRWRLAFTLQSAITHSARPGSLPVGDGGALEHAQSMAAHESPRTTKLYDRTKERLTQDEVERIRL